MARLDLLRQLAEHLLNGKLGHQRFDFTTFNNVYDFVNGETNVCGTNGCAAGEMPFVWPDKFKFYKNVVVYINEPIGFEYTGSPFDVVMHFFEIDERMSCHLFNPSTWNEDIEEWEENEVYQNPYEYGGEILGEDATKEQVAANIIAFCERYEKNNL